MLTKREILFKIENLKNHEFHKKLHGPGLSEVPCWWCNEIVNLRNQLEDLKVHKEKPNVRTPN